MNLVLRLLSSDECCLILIPASIKSNSNVIVVILYTTHSHHKIYNCKIQLMFFSFLMVFYCYISISRAIIQQTCVLLNSTEPKVIKLSFVFSDDVIFHATISISTLTECVKSLRLVGCTHDNINVNYMLRKSNADISSDDFFPLCFFTIIWWICPEEIWIRFV